MKHDGILISHFPKAPLETKHRRTDSTLVDLQFFFYIILTVFVSLQCWIWRISNRCKYEKEIPKKCFDRSRLRYLKNFAWSSVRKVHLRKRRKAVKLKGWIKRTPRKIAPWKQSRECTCCVVFSFYYLFITSIFLFSWACYWSQWRDKILHLSTERPLCYKQSSHKKKADKSFNERKPT